MLDQITPLVLTYNEAPNIGRTLKQLSWANDIVIVDSFSDDATKTIVAGFPHARIFERVFDSHREQWKFGLKETGIKTPWVLALDADYVLSDELVSELKALQQDESINGYQTDFIYCLNGKRLRSGIYPSVTVLYRREFADYFQDGHTQRVQVTGPIARLQSKILHDDRKPLKRWFFAQVNYAELEAKKLAMTKRGKLSFEDRLRSWCIVAPAAVVVHCLIFRGGIFDGWAGFFYAFQRSLAELMLSLFLLEFKILHRQDDRVTSLQSSVDGNENQHQAGI